MNCSSAPLIGCCKQPVKYADLCISVTCEDINTFFNKWIVRNYSFTQLLSSCPVLSSRWTRVSGFVSFSFFFFFTKESPLCICSTTPLITRGRARKNLSFKRTVL